MRAIRGTSVVESLKDFIAERAEKLRSEEPYAAKKRDEWTAAVDRLSQRITEWLTLADPEQKILKLREHIYQLREEGIGSYEVSGLSIALGPREIRVEPIAKCRGTPVGDRCDPRQSSVRASGHDGRFEDIHDLQGGHRTRRSLEHHRAGRLSDPTLRSVHLRGRFQEPVGMMNLDQTWKLILRRPSVA